MTKKYTSLEHAIRKVHINPQYKKINEDFEYEMARNELRTAIDAAKRLMKHLEGEGDIEAWVQSKITKASDYLDTVADYMDSSTANKLKEELNEAIGIIGKEFLGNKFTKAERISPPGHSRDPHRSIMKAISDAGSRRVQKQAGSATMQGDIHAEEHILEKKIEKEDGNFSNISSVADWINQQMKPSDSENDAERLQARQQRVKNLKAKQSSAIEKEKEIQKKIESGQLSADDAEKEMKKIGTSGAALTPAIKIGKQVSSATPETTAERLQGAKGVATSVHAPVAAATIGSSVYGHLQKGDIGSAATEVGTAMATRYGLSKLFGAAGKYLDKDAATRAAAAKPSAPSGTTKVAAEPPTTKPTTPEKPAAPAPGKPPAAPAPGKPPAAPAPVPASGKTGKAPAEKPKSKTEPVPVGAKKPKGTRARFRDWLNRGKTALRLLGPQGAAGAGGVGTIGDPTSAGTQFGVFAKEENDQERKSVENVARPKNIAKNKIHARQESIQKKIIDEARVKAAIIKDAVNAKKKEEKKSGSNPMIDFDPKLKRPGTDNTVY